MTQTELQLIRTEHLSEDFILEHSNEFEDYWRIIFRYQTLSEDFIYKIITEEDLSQECNCLENIFKYQTLSEDFITKIIPSHCSISCWPIICKYQILSEDFIQEHEGYFMYDGYLCGVNINPLSKICKYQILSEDFIRNHQEKFNCDHWRLINKYQILSEDFKQEMTTYYNL